MEMIDYINPDLYLYLYLYLFTYC